MTRRLTIAIGKIGNEKNENLF